MKRIIRSIGALLLIACMVLTTGVVLPVYAEEAAKTVEYSFSAYESVFNSSGNISLTGDANKTTLNTAYESGTVNSAYFTRWRVDSNITSAGVHYRYDYDDLYVQTKVGTAVALKFKSPGDGDFNISVLPRYYSKGAQKCDVYIYSAEGKKSILSTDMVAANLVTDSLNLLNVSTAQSIGSMTFEANKDYLIVFKPTVCKDGSTTNGATAEIDLFGITMTQIVAEVEDPIASSVLNGETQNYTSADALAEAINNAEEGTKFTLLADVTTATELTLESGVTLDLNGKTLTATADATQGILTDSSNGGGKIANTAVFDEVGSNEVALVDGEYFRIFDYQLKEVETVENGDTVHFWFDVTLSNDAYALIAKEDNDSKFNVGATLQWNDNEPQTLSYDGNLNVKDWAAKMQTADYSFYVKVTGLSSAAESGTLKVMPTVSGRVGGGTLANAMTCSVEAAQ